MAAAAAEQSQTGVALAGNIEQVAAMVEDTQRAAGQTVGAVRRIDTLSATLKHSVDRFRL
ncbi:hypothetical protein [Crenobacter cavernae]|uniref:Methyl-accepting chemotaxis protein n=1 Tax=Crenobacter cavernae TaxID=2290923 RepID=A0A345Y9K6_9NEIS|nr:hypothetical protein [Crenobacter cavernae]AXK40608.1 hypothetical protein DWG20_14915 [Crenobacter cavernae]